MILSYTGCPKNLTSFENKTKTTYFPNSGIYKIFYQKIKREIFVRHSCRYPIFSDFFGHPVLIFYIIFFILFYIYFQCKLLQSVL